MPIKEGGGPNPPVRLDPFRRIVNVHWPAPNSVYLAVQVAFQIQDSSLVYISSISHPPSNIHFGLTDIIGFWVWRDTFWASSSGAGVSYLSPMPSPSGTWSGSPFNIRLSILGGASGLGPDIPPTPVDGPLVDPAPFSQAPLLQVVQSEGEGSSTLDLSTVELSTSDGVYHCVAANAWTDAHNTVNGVDVIGGSPIFFLFVREDVTA